MELYGRMALGPLGPRSPRFFSLMGIVSQSILFTEKTEDKRIVLKTPLTQRKVVVSGQGGSHLQESDTLDYREHEYLVFNSKFI